ncbi:tRNA (5-methylaminomethyl-2-thiouridine)(34)-methyltransferase MnmD [Paraflavisolibacter sp. H34]|uniref:tRNA (5-methylaminomethyl-2-thiouridine)(34)-methyltransferase MnmD n=1 Tax=Huijunlia imazamoxiresistens TaxID=3127457 RepID=UPI00301A8280
MKREIIYTADGSHTVAIPEMEVTYHSHNGALQESLHVFIDAGLREAFRLFEGPIKVFEMGFGTGLNALLTALEAEKEGRQVAYTSLELYPLSEEETKGLNYGQLLPGSEPLLQQLHRSPWGEEVRITDQLCLTKVQTSLFDFATAGQFHVIYYDAFAPRAQPELWTEDIFKKLRHLLVPEGLLVTYCSKSVVRRAMMAAGFTVKKVPGPRGKREMVRAYSPLPASPGGGGVGGARR